MSVRRSIRRTRQTPLLIAGALVFTLAVALWSVVALPNGASAAFPGRNGLIVYDTPGPNFAIVVSRLNGSHRRRLARSGFQPSFSADGKQIVFQDGNNDLVLMHADGTSRRSIPLTLQNGVFPHKLSVEDPSFSPDGTRIVFDDANDGAVYVVNVDGSGLKKLIGFPPPRHPAGNSATGVFAQQPVFAPDGNSILFGEAQCFPSPTYHCKTRLFLMKPDGSHVRPVPNSAQALNGTFSPDGNTITFMRGGDIFRMSSAGSQVRRLTKAPAGAEDLTPAFSPDGGSIIFERLNPRINFDALMVMRANGSRLRQLTYGGGEPSWQPLP